MNKKKYFLSLFLTLLVVAVIFFGATVGNILSVSRSSGEFSASMDERSGDKVNILAMGLDGGKNRADTIMLVSLDKTEKSAKILSIPRDTKVKAGGRTIKINSAIGFDNGAQLMVEKVKEITGLPIHYCAEVDFSGFIEIVDILGGVNYNVPYDMDYDDPYQDLSIHLKAGMQHLNGKKAHDYVRFRHNNNGSAPGNYVLGDPGRIEAQQNFIRELVNQKLKLRYLLRSYSLAHSISKYVTTDFPVSEGIRYAFALRKMDSDQFQTFTLPGEGKMIGGASYYVYDEAKTAQLIEEEFE